MDILIKLLFIITALNFLLAWIYWEYNYYYEFKIKKFRRLEIVFKRCGIISGALLGVSLLIDLIIKYII